jgi:hypothetical protein
MSDEMESAEKLMNILETDYAGQIIGTPEYLAMHTLANEISSALGGSWMSSAGRTRVWLAANSQHEHDAKGRFFRLPSTRTMVTGGAALALSAFAGYAFLHRHRRVAAAA